MDNFKQAGGSIFFIKALFKCFKNGSSESDELVYELVWPKGWFFFLIMLLQQGGASIVKLVPAKTCKIAFNFYRL